MVYSQQSKFSNRYLPLLRQTALQTALTHKNKLLTFAAQGTSNQVMIMIIFDDFCFVQELRALKFQMIRFPLSFLLLLLLFLDDQISPSFLLCFLLSFLLYYNAYYQHLMSVIFVYIVFHLASSRFNIYKMQADYYDFESNVWLEQVRFSACSTALLSRPQLIRYHSITLSDEERSVQWSKLQSNDHLPHNHYNHALDFC